jgi:hypothetical protein
MSHAAKTVESVVCLCCQLGYMYKRRESIPAHSVLDSHSQSCKISVHHSTGSKEGAA